MYKQCKIGWQDQGAQAVQDQSCNSTSSARSISRIKEHKQCKNSHATAQAVQSQIAGAQAEQDRSCNSTSSARPVMQQHKQCKISYATAQAMHF